MAGDIWQDDMFVEASKIDDINSLFREVLNFRTGKRFRDCLEFCARFRKLSAFNAMLLKAQRPGCRYALTLRAWRRDYARVIKTDARPLVIIRPFGPVDFLFDIGDTIPINSNYEKIPQEVSQAYQYKKEIPEWLYNKVVNNLPYWGVKYGDMLTGASFEGKLEVYHAGNDNSRLKFANCKGKMILPEQWTPTYTLKVRSGVSHSQAFGVILHEMGHLVCRHIHCSYEKPWNDRQARVDLNHEQKEFEAETVAWLVSHRQGYDLPDAYSYLASYMNSDEEIPGIDLQVVLQAVSEVERLLEDCDIRSGWLWKYSPHLQDVVNSLNRSK